MDDLEAADYSLVIRTPRRGGKRLRESHGEDEGEDSDVAKRQGAGEWNVRNKVMAHENINSTGTAIPVRKSQPFKVRMGKSDEDIAYEDAYYAPTPRLSRSPSPNWMSAFEGGASYQDDAQNANYASSTGQRPSPRWISGFETAASSPTVVTAVQEQEYASTTVDLDDSKLNTAPNANERVRTLPLLARKLHSHTSAFVAGRRRVASQDPRDAARSRVERDTPEQVLARRMGTFPLLLRHLCELTLVRYRKTARR
ncbi:hypothetical protein EXIGLDRAFT_732514 [Exidia glandulosa HHB12029]|uniref:Uncharacterized protein n=1 Tax=Exidia glandulosa HHB12029 TaxID=1314781 RepID=A0A165KR14_EXIGL|nr:hypothetical protein EXIGLDRAFT_732514 [Exidia glandulosa HHB12029]